ncbi:DUF6923 family protein [Actinomadura oligospora]|uniref:DUF6923 family protein n=1 Tax=Actinomadura oligospora TaxID=111804 RepID=UPI00047D95A7|nr:hypothetical protein [Actinomadura oligospora]
MLGAGLDVAAAESAARCDGVAYVVAEMRVAGARQTRRTRGDGRRVLGRMDMVTGVVRPIVPKPGLDALGYDVGRGVLYGVENDPDAPSVLTIDPKDGSAEESVELPQDVYTAGAVAPDGLFYVRGRSTVQVVDVRDKGRVVRSFDVGREVRLDDFAVRPKDGQIFGVDNARGDLVRIDPRSGRVKRFGRLGVGRVTAAFFDRGGMFRVVGRRMASVDVGGLRSGARKVDVRLVGVHPVRPPRLLDGAGCLKAVPRPVNDVPAPKVAPAPKSASAAAKRA